MNMYNQRQDIEAKPTRAQHTLPRGMAGVIRKDRSTEMRRVHEDARPRGGVPNRRFDIARDVPWLSWDKPIATQDADFNYFVQNELSLMLPDLVMVETRASNTRNMIAVRYLNEPGISQWRYKQVEDLGQAEIASSGSTEPPVAEVSAKEFIHDVRKLWISASWDVDEILAAQFAKNNGYAATAQIDQAKLNSARKAILQLEEEIAWFGSPKFNLLGYLSEGTAIPKTQSPFALDLNQTPDNMYTVLNTGVNEIVTQTYGIETPTLIGLGTEDFIAVNTKITGDNKDRTVGQSFVDQNPWIDEIVWIPQLGFSQQAYDQLIKDGYSAAEATRLAGGINGQSVMMTWDRSMDKSALVVVSDLQLGAPQQWLEKITTLVTMKTGGVEIRKPRAHHILTGV